MERAVRWPVEIKKSKIKINVGLAKKFSYFLWTIQVDIQWKEPYWGSFWDSIGIQECLGVPTILSKRPLATLGREKATG